MALPSVQRTMSYAAALSAAGPSQADGRRIEPSRSLGAATRPSSSAGRPSAKHASGPATRSAAEIGSAPSSSRPPFLSHPSPPSLNSTLQRTGAGARTRQGVKQPVPDGSKFIWQGLCAGTRPATPVAFSRLLQACKRERSVQDSEYYFGAMVVLTFGRTSIIITFL